MEIQYKGKIIHLQESFYWNTTESFNRGELGGGICRCIKTDDSLATLVIEDGKNFFYKGDNYCGTLNCTKQMEILEEQKEYYKTIIGNKQKNPFRGDIESVSPCITSACGMGGGMTPMLTDATLEESKSEEFIEQVRGHKELQYRIRKLTPKECFRLMGVEDKDIDKIQNAGISNSQQYKLAGNSIVVDVLFHIFRKMFIEKESESNELTLF